MTFSEALEEMKKGKKIKLSYWPDDNNVFINEMGFICFQPGPYEPDIGSILCGDDILSNDWKIAP